MIVFEVSLNFGLRNFGNTMSDLYFNKEGDYSEEIQAAVRTLAPPFLNYFSLSPDRKKLVVMRAIRKKQQKQPVVHRCS